MTAETLTVATIALEKVIEGDLDEARELVGQLSQDGRHEIRMHIAELLDIVATEIIAKRIK